VFVQQALVTVFLKCLFQKMYIHFMF